MKRLPKSIGGVARKGGKFLKSRPISVLTNRTTIVAMTGILLESQFFVSIRNYQQFYEFLEMRPDELTGA